MALGLGAGAELRAPLAITVIGGLSVATLLTLFVIPVVYTLLGSQQGAHWLSSRADLAREVQNDELPGVGRTADGDSGRRARCPFRVWRSCVRSPPRWSSSAVLVIGGIALWSSLPHDFLPQVDVPLHPASRSPTPNSNPDPSRARDHQAGGRDRCPRFPPDQEALARRPMPMAPRSVWSFEWGQDLDIIRMQVSEKMDQIEARVSRPTSARSSIFSFSTE